MNRSAPLVLMAVLCLAPILVIFATGLRQQVQILAEPPARRLRRRAHQEAVALGHEVSGVVEAVGEQVTGQRGSFQVGERIAISPSRPCSRCRFCQAGQHNHCWSIRFYGSAMPFPHIQGAFRRKAGRRRDPGAPRGRSFEPAHSRAG